MPAKSVFTVIGGDKRLYFLAQELLKTGPVICCAAAEVPQGAVRADSLREAFQSLLRGTERPSPRLPPSLFRRR